MASVNKRKWTHKGETKEAWVVRYTDGGGVRRMKTFDKKKDADKARLQIETEIEKGIHTPTSESARISALAEQFLELERTSLRDKHIGALHYEGMERTIRKHILPTLGHRLVSELTFNIVEDWYQKLCATDTVGAPRARAIGSMLRRLVAFGMKRGHVHRNVAGDMLQDRRSVSNEKIRTFSKEQVAILLRVAGIRPPQFHERAHALVLAHVHFAVFCGLRRGEIMGLTIPDIDLSARVVRVRHSLTAKDELKGPKTRAGIRDVPMPEHMVALIKDWLERFYIEDEREIVYRLGYGQQLCNTNFHMNYWRPLLDRAGIGPDPVAGYHHFHALRHFAASVMIEQRLPLTDVAAMLEHARFDTTLQVYAHSIMPEHIRHEAVERVARTMLGAPEITIDGRVVQERDMVPSTS